MDIGICDDIVMVDRLATELWIPIPSSDVGGVDLATIPSDGLLPAISVFVSPSWLDGIYGYAHC